MLKLLYLTFVNSRILHKSGTAYFHAILTSEFWSPVNSPSPASFSTAASLRNLEFKILKWLIKIICEVSMQNHQMMVWGWDFYSIILELLLLQLQLQNSTEKWSQSLNLPLLLTYFNFCTIQLIKWHWNVSGNDEFQSLHASPPFIES